MHITASSKLCLCQYAITALGIIIGLYCGALAGILYACAAFLISSPYAPYANVAKVHKWRFDHMDYPWLYKRASNVCYAHFQGTDTHVGTENLYYERVF